MDRNATGLWSGFTTTSSSSSTKTGGTYDDISMNKRRTDLEELTKGVNGFFLKTLNGIATTRGRGELGATDVVDHAFSGSTAMSSAPDSSWARATSLSLSSEGGGGRFFFPFFTRRALREGGSGEWQTLIRGGGLRGLRRGGGGGTGGFLDIWMTLPSGMRTTPLARGFVRAICDKATELARLRAAHNGPRTFNRHGRTRPRCAISRND